MFEVIPEIQTVEIESNALHFVLARHLYNVLKRNDGNVTKSSCDLKIYEKALYRKIQRYGIKIKRITRIVDWPMIERARVANGIVHKITS